MRQTWRWRVVNVLEKPEVSQLIAQLSSGVERLGSEGRWEQFLAAQARFHRYSYANTLLILDQFPEATTVAGFNTWRGAGRSVRRGERAIWIVAPLARRSDQGTSATEIIGFRRVGVFDVSQTEGEDLVSLCKPLEGGDEQGWFTRLVDVAVALGFTVDLEALAPDVFGDCTYALRRIRIAAAASPAQAVKTLAHELGHALLHEHVEDRPLAELEAESIAYVVCQHLGLDTERYSFGYVTTWAGGADAAIRSIKRSCARIGETSRMIIEMAALPSVADAGATEPPPGHGRAVSSV
jgi:predicted small secreted protein